MGEATKIEWCDKTWSPWRGCTKVSEGCRNCYADRQSVRNPKTLGVWGLDGTRVLNANWAQLVKWDREAFKAGQMCRIFPSLCDPFEDFKGQLSNHKGELITCDQGTPYMMDDARREFFSTTILLKSLLWLILTKRPENITSMWPGHYLDEADIRDFQYPQNVWLGTSVENQEAADERIPHLLKCRKMSPVLWLSVEPLLGPIDLSTWFWSMKSDSGKCAIDWVIVGGESGPKARPCNPEWIRSICNQCESAGVPCFIKQMGGNVITRNDQIEDVFSNGLFGWPDPDVEYDINGYREDYQGADCRIRLRDPKGGDPEEWAIDLRVREFPEVNQ